MFFMRNLKNLSGKCNQWFFIIIFFGKSNKQKSQYFILMMKLFPFRCLYLHHPIIYIPQSQGAEGVQILQKPWVFINKPVEVMFCN